ILHQYTYKHASYSSPTRRSSDLAHRLDASARQQGVTVPTTIESTPQPSRRCGRCRNEFPLEPGADPRTASDWWACGPCHAVLLRSEEHTSELQSRENLVCRLLLE